MCRRHTQDAKVKYALSAHPAAISVHSYLNLTLHALTIINLGNSITQTDAIGCFKQHSVTKEYL